MAAAPAKPRIRAVIAELAWSPEEGAHDPSGRLLLRARMPADTAQLARKVDDAEANGHWLTSPTMIRQPLMLPP